MAEAVIFDRTRIGREGSGHFSPPEADDACADRSLLTDVARYKPATSGVPISLRCDAVRPVKLVSTETRDLDRDPGTLIVTREL